MEYKEIRKYIDELKGSLKLSLNPELIIKSISGDEKEQITLKLFKIFNNGRIDIFLDHFLSDYKEKLVDISLKTTDKMINVIQNDLSQYIKMRLTDIENRTTIANENNEDYNSVIKKLKENQTSFTELEMLNFIVADLHHRLVHLANEMMFELNNLKSIRVKKFSAFQWAIIFYYAFEYKQLSSKLKKDAISEFILKYCPTTGFNSIKNDHVSVRNKIKSSSIKLTDLEDVIGFIETTFNTTIAEAINYDITTIKDDQDRI